MKSSPEIKLRLFNVGQGDHMLLELPDGSFGIVDFFYSGSKGWVTPPAQLFLENLKQKKEIKIAFICISHPDVDHIKGLDKFLKWAEDNRIPIERIWRYPGPNPGEMKIYLENALQKSKFADGALENNKVLDTNLDALDSYIKRRKPDVRYLHDIKEISNKIAGFIDAKCLAPLEEHTQQKNSEFWIRFFQAYLERKKLKLNDKNILSSIVQLLFGKFNLLFGGDTELQVWQDCMAHSIKNNLKISWQPDFIKISHHGSNTSSSIDLWENLLSEPLTYIGISSWKKDFPHNETIEHIIQASINTKKKYKLLATSICGECAISQPFKSIDASWVTKVETNTFEAHVLKKCYSKDYLNVPESEMTVSYVLTFSLKQASILVEKEIIKTKFAQKCIYNGSSGKTFPSCVL